MDLLVKELHELLHVAAGLHGERRHDDGRGTDVAAAVLELTQSVDVVTVGRATAHGGEIRARVVAVVAGIAAPVDVGVVGIEALRGGAHGELLEVVVGRAGLVVDTFHILEDAAGEDRRVVMEADALERAEQQRARHQTAFLQGARAVVD